METNTVEVRHVKKNLVGCAMAVLGTLQLGCSGSSDTGGDGGTGGAVGGTGATSGAGGSAGSGGVAGSGGGTCPGGYAECDGDLTTVCEAALSSDPANCGACGQPCVAGANQDAACSQGQCVVACKSGFADCNFNPADGCETNTSTDTENCGTCGHDCGPSACSSSVCEMTTLASGLPNPVGITADDTHVYWANYVQDGAVMRVAKTGGTAETLAANVVFAYEVFVDGSDLYFTSNGTPPNADGTLHRMPKGGGTPVTLASSQVGSNEIWVDDTYVYWACTYQATTNATIQRMPKSGGSAQQVAAAENHIVDLRVFEGKLYWMTLGTAASNYADGAIVRSELDGSSRTVLVSGIGKPSFEFGMTAQNLYFGSRADSTLLSAPLAGGTAKVIGTTPGDQRSVEVDGGFLFFTSGLSGTLERMPLSGGPATTLATGQAKAFEIVTDATFVYWSDSGSSAADGAIRKTIR